MPGFPCEREGLLLTCCVPLQEARKKEHQETLASLRQQHNDDLNAAAAQTQETLASLRQQHTDELSAVAERCQLCCNPKCI